MAPCAYRSGDGGLGCCGCVQVRECRDVLRILGIHWMLPMGRLEVGRCLKVYRWYVAVGSGMLGVIGEGLDALDGIRAGASVHSA